MITCKRHNRRSGGISLRRVVQTWLVAFFVLFAGVTQSGLVPALLSGQATGVATASAAEIAPGGDYVLICTPAGIKLVSADTLDGVVASNASGQADEMPTHAFCPLCANHHGAMAAIDLPYVAPVPVIHDVSYAKAIAFVAVNDIPRGRHSRAPPVSI
ncbi:DUF2946 family protein [Thalassospira indica]|uniref:DUF2946 domain-containing protein n=1 Tax=Thalassospira indica TaxID=1891279 RepID=A0ABM6Y3T6_9PROT|nr:DUF2946 family protein [Thalassospira indica]AXO15924.1 hypothetical protein DY252_18105 [Thalassospira indica]OAZ13482.1 hypothetical protein TH15_10630 [Thalassospira profundimaris]